MDDQFSYRPRPDSPFGMIYCSRCNMCWPDGFVPEYCTECGAYVTDQPGKGMADYVRMIRTYKLPISILQCPNCKLEYTKTASGYRTTCFRCRRTLVNAEPIRNILRKTIFRFGFLHLLTCRIKRMLGLYRPQG